MLFLVIDDNNIYLSDPDVGLMLQFQKGNSTSFEQLMEKYYSPILNFIYRMVGNKEHAEDITQEVFVKIHENINNYQPRSTFKTWVYVIAKNLSLNELRRGKYQDKDVIIEGDEVDHDLSRRPEDQYIKDETVEAVKAAIQELPENQRLAVVLRRYQDLSYEEIAAALKTSEKAVKSLLNRAKENLRVKLEKFVD